MGACCAQQRPRPGEAEALTMPEESEAQPQATDQLATLRASTRSSVYWRRSGGATTPEKTPEPGNRKAALASAKTSISAYKALKEAKRFNQAKAADPLRGDASSDHSADSAKTAPVPSYRERRAKRRSTVAANVSDVSDVPSGSSAAPRKSVEPVVFQIGDDSDADNIQTTKAVPMSEGREDKSTSDAAVAIQRKIRGNQAQLRKDVEDAQAAMLGVAVTQGAASQGAANETDEDGELFEF